MELYFSEIMDRAKGALHVVSDGEMAEAIGMSPTAYSNRKKKGSIPFEQLMEALKSRKVDFNYVFYGVREGVAESPDSYSVKTRLPPKETGVLLSVYEMLRQYLDRYSIKMESEKMRTWAYGAALVVLDMFDGDIGKAEESLRAMLLMLVAVSREDGKNGRA